VERLAFGADTAFSPAEELLEGVTIAPLTGSIFAGGIEDHGFGRGTMLGLPGAGEVLLYEPRHPAAYDL